MAASGYTPIQLYHSTTASAVPVNTNLVDGELAINIADGKLYYKDSGGTVQVIATKGAGTIGGSNTQVQYNSSGALAGSANFTFNGTTATINTLNLTNALGAAYGGTAQSTYTQGDLLYASAANTLSKLAIGSNNQVLTSNGTDPVWVSGLNITTLTATQDVTFSATSQNIALGTSQTSGLFTIGGASQTGAIVIGQSTKTQSLSIANGAVESGLTKTINIGTNGDSGSTTNINIGSGSGTITTNFSGTVNAVTTNVVGSLTASNAVTFSATTQNIALGTSQSSGTWTAGGASQTGALTLDQSTKTHTLNLGTGATESGETKTINLGTGGVSTSTTAINIGSANGTTLTINSSAVSTPNGLNFDSNTFVIDATNNRVGINNASPTVALDVTGALTISGNAILGDASTDTVTVNGYMGVGGAVDSTSGIKVSSAALTGTTQRGLYVLATSTNGATNAFRGIQTSISTPDSAFTMTSAIGFYAATGAKGAASTVTNWHGAYIDDQTQGTNNYGITSVVSSGTNKWNIYASGSANNAFAGNVRIGSTTAPTNALDVTGAMTVSGNTTLGDATTDTVTVNGYMSTGGAANASNAMYPRNTALTGTTQTGVYSAITGASDATSAIYGVVGDVRTAAAAFTVTNVSQFLAADATKGAGSTITNQHGIRIADQTQGTNNFGITSLVSSGTNKWNIYASGTAANYFAGNVLVGTTAALGTAGVQAAAVSTDPFEGYRFGANANGPTVSLYKNRGATVGTNAVVVSGDELGTIAFRGYDGAAYRAGAFITGNVDGTPGASDMPGRLTFSTTADGAATPTERMRIDASGNVRVGTAALATTATNGFLYIPTCAGTPTGTPTAITGLAPMVIDSTNNKLYIYSGGAWVALN